MGTFFRSEHHYHFPAVLFLRRVDYKKKEYMVGTTLHMGAFFRAEHGHRKNF